MDTIVCTWLFPMKRRKKLSVRDGMVWYGMGCIFSFFIRRVHIIGMCCIITTLPIRAWSSENLSYSTLMISLLSHGYVGGFSVEVVVSR